MALHLRASDLLLQLFSPAVEPLCYEPVEEGLERLSDHAKDGSVSRIRETALDVHATHRPHERRFGPVQRSVEIEDQE